MADNPRLGDDIVADASEKKNDELGEIPDSYHAARRMLVFFSGLLLAWEYVGFSVVQAGDDSAEITAPLVGVKLNIRNPEVIPTVIFLLVLFFGVRLGVEWFQLTMARRERPATRIDVGLAGFLATTAVVLFGVQQSSGFVVADTIDTALLVDVFFTTLIVSSPHLVIALIWKWPSLSGLGPFFWPGVALLVMVLLLAFGMGFGIIPTSESDPDFFGGTKWIGLASLLGIPVWFWRVGADRGRLWTAINTRPHAV